MRTTVMIDDELFKKAMEVAEPGINKADLIREAIKTYVRVKSAARLAALGGTASEMSDIPRRTTESVER